MSGKTFMDNGLVEFRMMIGGLIIEDEQVYRCC